MPQRYIGAREPSEPGLRGLSLPFATPRRRRDARRETLARPFASSSGGALPSSEDTHLVDGQLLDILPQLCFQLDPGGRIVWANPAAGRKLAYHPTALVGLSFVELVRPRDRGVAVRLLRRSLRQPGRWLDWRYRHRRRDGSEFGVQAALRTSGNSSRGRDLLLVADELGGPRLAHEKVAGCSDCLGRALAAAHERQRRRIADGLHDRVGQDLALAVLKLGALKATLPPAADTAVEDVRRTLKQAIKSVRSLSFELAGARLCGLGLDRALRHLAGRLQRENGLEIDLQPPGAGDEDLPEETRLVVYQVVRELLLNVVKHARARTALVRLRSSGDWLEVELEDDGLGFEAEVAAGFGLLAARNRLHSVGGSLHVESAPGTGTRIELRVPTS